MIRVEVTSEADVTRMVAAFQVLETLQDQDYEILLVSGFSPGGGTGMRRAWRLNGLRGGTAPSTVIVYAGDPPPGGAGGGGGNSSPVRVIGGPPRLYTIGGDCSTCGKPVPGGGHTEECTGLVPGSEYLIGGGGGLPDRDGETGKGGS